MSVVADKIKLGKCLMEYLNGKGMFYVENDCYIPPEVGSMKDKGVPFVTVTYTREGRNKYRTPYIFMHNGSRYVKSYKICWNSSTFTTIKMFRIYSFNKFSDIHPDTDPKLILSNNVTFNSNPIKDPSNPGKYIRTIEDINITKLSFHLSEVYAFLFYLHLFDFKLSDFGKCSTNIEMYKLLESKINEYLVTKGVANTFVVDEESIEHFNDEIVYEKNGQEYVPCILTSTTSADGETLETTSLETLHYSFTKFIGDKKIKANKLFSGEKLKIFTALTPKKFVTNKVMIRTFEMKKKEGEEDAPTKIGVSTSLTSKINFINNVKYTAAELERSLWKATTSFDGVSFTPLTPTSPAINTLTSGNEVYGDIYFRFDTVLTTFGQSSWTISADVVAINLHKVERKPTAVNDFAVERAMEMKKYVANTLSLSTPNEDEEVPIGDYDDVSE